MILNIPVNNSALNFLKAFRVPLSKNRKKKYEKWSRVVLKKNKKAFDSYDIADYIFNSCSFDFSFVYFFQRARGLIELRTWILNISSHISWARLSSIRRESRYAHFARRRRPGGRKLGFFLFYRFITFLYVSSIMRGFLRPTTFSMFLKRNNTRVYVTSTLITKKEKSIVIWIYVFKIAKSSSSIAITYAQAWHRGIFLYRRVRILDNGRRGGWKVT